MRGIISILFTVENPAISILHVWRIMIISLICKQRLKCSLGAWWIFDYFPFRFQFKWSKQRGVEKKKVTSRSLYAPFLKKKGNSKEWGSK